jgi:hypothetical protein
VYNVRGRAGLHRRSARLAEALAATEGGPITERALRDIRAQEVTRRHVGSDTPVEQLFFDTMFVGQLKGVGKIWQYSAVDGACSFGFARVSGERRAPGPLAADPQVFSSCPSRTPSEGWPFRLGVWRARLTSFAVGHSSGA